METEKKRSDDNVQKNGEEVRNTKATFSKTLLKAINEEPLVGKLEGQCCMCGEHTKHGNKKKFGNNFTCSDYLENGDVICEYCQHLVSNSNKYRRTMFLLTDNEFRTFKKKDIQDIIFNLPSDEDFYLYLTQTWQKLGYVLMNKYRNTPPHDTVTVVMDYDVIRYKQETLREYYDLVVKLRKIKISKEVLQKASFEMHHLRRIIEAFGKEEAHSVLRTVEELKGNPIWDLATYISD